MLEWGMQPCKTGICWTICLQSRFWMPLPQTYTGKPQTCHGKPLEGDQDLFLPQGVEAAHSKAARDAIWPFSCGLAAICIAQTGRLGLIQKEYTTLVFWTDAVIGRIAHGKAKEEFEHWKVPSSLTLWGPHCNLSSGWTDRTKPCFCQWSWGYLVSIFNWVTAADPKVCCHSQAFFLLHLFTLTSFF